MHSFAFYAKNGILFDKLMYSSTANLFSTYSAQKHSITFGDFRKFSDIFATESSSEGFD